MYFLETTYLGRFHIGFIFAFGFGALVGIGALARALAAALSPVVALAHGNSASRDQHPRLWGFVANLTDEMGVAPPHAIIVGMEPNFYVTEARVRCFSGEMGGRTMYLSVLLLRIFTIDELRAVIAHELAHFRGMDTQFSRRFYPIYRGASEGIVGLESHLSSDSESGSATDLILMPAVAMMSYFLSLFSEAEREIGRERELVADAEAAKLASPEHLASALVKVHAFAQIWPSIRQKMKHALSNGVALINAGPLFGSIAEEMADKPGMLNIWIEDSPKHPTDTHPALSERLSALGVAFEQVESSARVVAPSEPAISLLEEAEKAEKELTASEQFLMIETGEVVVPATRNDEDSSATASPVEVENFVPDQSEMARTRMPVGEHTVAYTGRNWSCERCGQSCGKSSGFHGLDCVAVT